MTDANKAADPIPVAQLTGQTADVKDALPKPDQPEKASFPIVGIGASAGGLGAFESFFAGLRADSEPGFAIVLVQHLAPDHKSLLVDLVRRYTRMEVFEVEDGMVVRSNCIYIIPPGHDMAFFNGTLQLLAPTEAHGRRLSIDFFFRSLAQDQGERAIGIVLSGTGSDGTEGVRAIKTAGGMVMAQSPDSCEFDGMPTSAIATGLMDFVLPPGEMADRLIAYVSHACSSSMIVPTTLSLTSLSSEHLLQKVFALLHDRTGHDISLYKPGTVSRRIERRMAIHQITALENYIAFLQETPTEVEALFRDLLIGVTNFFRDPEAFQVLEHKVLPQICASKPAGSTIRVWSTGCSTGEEAYSIAILLHECLAELNQGLSAQVFATDIDSRAIARARSGLYPSSISANISPERLARYFTSEADGTGFRVRKSLRDMLVFSEQDAVRDPPFSKLDLIVCRNLLIYLGVELQEKLLRYFHYGLNDGGWLFLGSSEGIGQFDRLFVPIDRKARIYRSKKSDLRQVHGGQRGLAIMPADQWAIRRSPFRPDTAKVGAVARSSPRELTEQALLRHVSLSSALVDAQGEILYLHGRTGRYLEPAPGERSHNILMMAREGLGLALTSALRKAVEKQEIVRCAGLPVQSEGFSITVNLTIYTLRSGQGAAPESPLYLIVLEEPAPPSVAPESTAMGAISVAADDSTLNAETRISALKREVQLKDEYIQDSAMELQNSNEELQSANEELQSVNEELQSSNEELETSKEEQQSVNEELATVNTELQNRVGDLTRSTNDLGNLLSGTGIATLFLDQQLRIRRFTPSATEIINLIPSDVGRPLAHILTNLVGYDSLVADAQRVFDTLTTVELEVQAASGRWFLLRQMPYRTIDNVVDGVVITCMNISEIRQVRMDLQQAKDLNRLANVVRDAQDAITVQDLEGHMLAWNSGAERMYGWSEAEALLMNSRERIPQELRQEEFSRATELSQATILEPYRTRRLRKNGTVVAISMIATALLNGAGAVYAIATTERAG